MPVPLNVNAILGTNLILIREIAMVSINLYFKANGNETYLFYQILKMIYEDTLQSYFVIKIFDHQGV